jgi:hypothetical protein
MAARALMKASWEASSASAESLQITYAVRKATV